MLRYFCPSCWQSLPGDVEVCPFCSYHLAEFAALQFEEKLIRALEHPVPELRLLAIQLLGNLGSQAALPGLEIILETEKEDIYALRETLVALRNIRSLRSQELLDKAKQHPFPLIRQLAKRLYDDVQSE